SNPTSTATDQALCGTLVAVLGLPGEFLSQFLATKRPLYQVRVRFPAQDRAVGASCLRRPPACAPRCHKDYVVPRVLPGAGRMEREPAGPSMTCGSGVQPQSFGCGSPEA